jgi:hypothetical protein
MWPSHAACSALNDRPPRLGNRSAWFTTCVAPDTMVRAAAICESVAAGLLAIRSSSLYGATSLAATETSNAAGST